MNISSGDALWHWSDGVTLGVGILKFVAIGGKVNTAVNAHEIKIEKSGRVVWGRCAQLAFEVINGIVGARMRSLELSLSRRTVRAVK